MSASHHRVRGVGLALLTLTLLGPAVAAAQQRAGAGGMLSGGTLALGYDTIPGAVTGRYMLDSSIGIDAWLGFFYEPYNADRDGAQPMPPLAPTFQDALSFTLGAGIVYAWQVHERASINFVGRLIYAKSGSHAVRGDASGLSIVAGLGPELFLFDKISVEVIFGLNFGMQFLETGGMMSRSYSTFAINTFGAGVSIVQGATFRIYLD